MSGMLKKKSKIIAKPKDRVKYDAFDFNPRLRILPEEDKQSEKSNPNQETQVNQVDTTQPILRVGD